MFLWGTMHGNFGSIKGINLCISPWYAPGWESLRRCPRLFPTHHPLAAFICFILFWLPRSFTKLCACDVRWLTGCSGAVWSTCLHRWSVGCCNWSQRLHPAVWQWWQLWKTSTRSVKQWVKICKKSGTIVMWHLIIMSDMSFLSSVHTFSKLLKLLWTDRDAVWDGPKEACVKPWFHVKIKLF